LPNERAICIQRFSKNCNNGGLITKTMHTWICLTFFTTWRLQTKLLKACQYQPGRGMRWTQRLLS
jgi:hypothetical protein